MKLLRTVRREVWLSWPADPRRRAARLMVVEMLAVRPGLGWLVVAQVGPLQWRWWCWRASQARRMYAAAAGDAARFSRFLGRFEHRSVLPAVADRKVCGMHEHEREREQTVGDVRPELQPGRVGGSAVSGPGDAVPMWGHPGGHPELVFDTVRGSR